MCCRACGHRNIHVMCRAAPLVPSHPCDCANNSAMVCATLTNESAVLLAIGSLHSCMAVMVHNNTYLTHALRSCLLRRPLSSGQRRRGRHVLQRRERRSRQPRRQGRARARRGCSHARGSAKGSGSTCTACASRRPPPSFIRLTQLREHLRARHMSARSFVCQPIFKERCSVC